MQDSVDVKLKVLKIIRHALLKGHPSFRNDMRRATQALRHTLGMHDAAGWPAAHPPACTFSWVLSRLSWHRRPSWRPPIPSSARRRTGTLPIEPASQPASQPAKPRTQAQFWSLGWRLEKVWHRDRSHHRHEDRRTDEPPRSSH